MSYSRCWLNYYKIYNYKDADLLTKLYLFQMELGPVGSRINNAVQELRIALSRLLDIQLACEEIKGPTTLSTLQRGILLGRADQEAFRKVPGVEKIKEEGFLIHQSEEKLLIIGKTDQGILYGVFELLRRISMGVSIRGVSFAQNPMNPLRMLNHWDNLDGSIERGYSGGSFFFKNEEILISERTRDYARLIASIGLNGVAINNVNVRGFAASGLITDRYLDKLKELNRIFSGYGIKLFVSANFAAPIEIGGMDTADPCNEEIAAWWRNCIGNIYKTIPDFGGFLIKADSEGRPGPFTYGRTQAEGANVLARALKPYGGLLIWRCFVYNCQQDWRDDKTDRARAAYDSFITLDGCFDDNVILQIKNGPMDFQVREPVSPLFGGLRKTNQILEVQITQEYTGQQKHVCYLAPMWKEVLGFNTYGAEGPATVADIVAGTTYGQTYCGMAAVANTGSDENWTGHDLAAANLYGFGRLSWNTMLQAEEISKEWILLTFEHREKVLEAFQRILKDSWLTYERYTSPLGIGWMVSPNHHYGPNVDGYEYDKWGTYHRADRNGLGVNRTRKGTGFTSQYNEPNASMYENISTCPEELLLFFHHVPYDYVLKAGQTLIQHIYNTHFEGVKEVEAMIVELKSIQEWLPGELYHRLEERFEMQLESAVEWRDQINTYFYRKSGEEDVKHRKIYR